MCIWTQNDLQNVLQDKEFTWSFAQVNNASEAERLPYQNAGLVKQHIAFWDSRYTSW